MIGSSGASLVTGAMICAPEDRMRVHDHPLLPGQLLLLQQDVVGDADLADVVEQAAPLERLQLAALTRIPARCRPRSSLTRWLCSAVNGSRLSTASASAPIVCVNMSRISTKRWDATRVVYSGRANSRVVHHWMP